MTDYYGILGVKPDATAEDIKLAYRRLASIHHPDKGGNTEKFQDIEAAYRILSDPEKRAEYDRPPPSQFPGGFHFNFNEFAFNDIFAQFARQQTQQQHVVYRTTINITLEQVYYGSQHNINLQSRAGNITATINSPAGIEHGQQVKYDNIIRGGSLIVTFIVLPHLVYSRQGSDIISEVDVSVLDLIAGTIIHVRGIDGREFLVTIPERTQPATVLRIPGAGLPVLNTSSCGDHRIRINAIIPASIPQAVIQAIKNTNNVKE